MTLPNTTADRRDRFLTTSKATQMSTLATSSAAYSTSYVGEASHDTALCMSGLSDLRVLVCALYDNVSESPSSLA